MASQDLNWTSNATYAAATWPHFADLESPVVRYEWAVGTAPGLSDLLPFTAVGLRTAAFAMLPADAVAAFAADAIYVTVRATNRVGLVGAASSDGLRVDATPPVPVYVRDGYQTDIDWTSFVDTLFANWLFQDRESGITTYEVAWGSAPGNEDVVNFTAVSMSTVYMSKQEYSGNLRLALDIGVLCNAR